MTPADIQDLLERIYEVRAPHQVADFLVTDPGTVRRLEGAGGRDIPEKLLVSEDDEGLALTLYLDAGVLERLRHANPLARLHRGNLSDFWIALEGVSHFLYLTWRARQRHSVSLLELEMQAEVDKYIAAAQLLGQQLDGRVPAALHDWLFEHCSYDPALDPLTLQRYQDASRYAGKYCHRLRRRYLDNTRSPGWGSEVRRFYRYSQPRKIRHIVHGH